SPARRSALLALADEHQVPILEDDYDSELRYAGPVLPALKSDDAAGQVVYAGTFSKVLFPSLRLGYVVADRPLLARLATMRLASDFGSGVVAQAALATLLATRGFDRHVRRMRRLYAARLAALLAALRRDMPPGTRWTEPRSGHVVWVTLPPGIDPERLEHAARGRGVAYTRGETFHIDGRGGDSPALPSAPLDPRTIAEGVARLGAAVSGQIATWRVPGQVRPAAGRSGRGRRPAGRGPLCARRRARCPALGAARAGRRPPGQCGLGGRRGRRLVRPPARGGSRHRSLQLPLRTRHRQRLRRRGCRTRRRRAPTGAARACARAERALLRPARARARRGYAHGPPAGLALAHRPARRLPAGRGARRADRGAGQAPARTVSTLPVPEEDQMRIEPIEAPKGL